MTELKHIDDPALLAALNRPLQELHVTNHPHLFKPYDEAGIMKYFADCLSNDTYLHIGAYVSGEAVGFVQAQVLQKQESVFSYGYRYVHVHQLSVLPAHRGKHIGQALMDAVMAHGYDQGVDMVDLTVWQFNEGTIRFYEQAGFATNLLRMYKPVQ